MWSGTLARQSHRVRGFSSSNPKKMHTRDPPCKGPSACQPCPGEEPGEASHELLEGEDTAGELPCSVSKIR